VVRGRVTVVVGGGPMVDAVGGDTDEVCGERDGGEGVPVVRGNELEAPHAAKRPRSPAIALPSFTHRTQDPLVWRSRVRRDACMAPFSFSELASAHSRCSESVPDRQMLV